jgi:hypothetical protein
LPLTSAVANYKHTMPETITTREILQFIGQGSDLPALEQFLVKYRVHDRPKTVLQLKDEEVLDEDDDDMDVEYELEKMSEDSQHVFSERYSFSLIFKVKSEYELIYGPRPEVNADFILDEVVFYAKTTRGQGYPAQLPGGLHFGVRRQDAAYQRLGPPVASRLVYDSQADLYAIDNVIVNFGFDDHDALAHVHVRWMHEFDRVMLSASKPAPAHEGIAPIGTSAIGQPVSSDEVQALLAALGIDEDDLDDGACPEEITSLTQSHGITLYFRDLPLSSKRTKKRATTQHLAAITYKRRGDLQSKGFHGALPLGFQFGDSPQTLKTKAMEPPGIEHNSDQLMSYFWATESGMIVQAMCSLIDWQLYRVTLHAAFLSEEIGFSGSDAAR